MTKQQRELHATIQSMAEEQVLFLKNRYKMHPEEIINLYTGEKRESATYSDAIHSVIMFSNQNVRRNGFLAS